MDPVIPKVGGSPAALYPPQTWEAPHTRPFVEEAGGIVHNPSMARGGEDSLGSPK